MSEEMKKVTGSLSIEANVECPHCEHYFDLFSIQSMIDDAHLWRRLFGKDQIGTDDLNDEIDCPKCHESFMVGEIEY